MLPELLFEWMWNLMQKMSYMVEWFMRDLKFGEEEGRLFVRIVQTHGFNIIVGVTALFTE